MKVKKFEIKFDNPQGVFEAGKTLSGFVHVHLVEPMKLRSIKLYFVGDGKTFWESNQGKNKAKYRERESYLNSFVTLVSSDAMEGSVKHPAGDHVYPFSIALQGSIPSSFEGVAGYVRYFCKATIDRPWKADSHVKRIFTVIRQLDLNTLPVATPYYHEKNEEIEGCCCNDGNVSVSLELNKTGYVPGEPIIYRINLHNKSTSTIHRCTLELRQICICYARAQNLFFTGSSLKQKEFKSPFFLFNGRVNVEPQKTGTFHKATTVPSLPPSKLEGCEIIDLKYIIILKIPGWTSNLKIQKEVIIGTIPIMEPLPLPTAPAPGAPIAGSPGAPGAPPSAPPTAPQEPTAPPSYEEALAQQVQPPPPSYEDCVFGTTQVRDETDGENTEGDVMWAPSYPYYDWSQHTNTMAAHYGMEPPTQAQMGQRTSDDDPNDDGGGRNIDTQL